MGMEIENNKMENIVEEEESDLSDSELLYHFKQALKSVEAGDEYYTEHYSQLIGVFSNNERLDEHEDALLVTSLRTLSRAVSNIDYNHHSSLLSTIFGMNMWNYGTNVMDALMELIKSLAASNGKFLNQCLEMLVHNFAPPTSFLTILDRPHGIARKEEVLYRVHSTLVDIANLAPLAPLLLISIVPQLMPRMVSKNDSSGGMIKMFLQKNEIYVENMLKLESGVLGKYLSNQMISEVVFRLVELDVEIEWDEILLDDPSKGIFEMELEDPDEDDDEDEDDDDLPKAGFGLQKLGADVYAEKLDTLMVLMCEHIKSCANNGRLREVFEILLLSFEKSVLKTHKSKFAQFVMFYACSLDPETCGVRFAKMLADTFVYEASPLTRMSAVAYLASYLSRARFLPDSLVAKTLTRLVDWCSEYCRIQGVEEKTINPLFHRVFYSGCQAVMYVICFRMRWMMEVPHLKSQLLQMPLENILRNPLHPLKVCLPSIVTEFLRQAKSAQLFTVSENNLFYDALESDLSKSYGGIERLDTFFPFDPCLLKNCDKFIRPKFLYWSMVKTRYGDDDDNSSDEENGFVDGNGECFVDGGMGSEFDEEDEDFDEFENSMNKMSITPKSTLKNRSGMMQMGARQMPARIRPSTSPQSL